MTIWYEPIDDRHYEFLYTLLKERPKHACISHKKMPTYEQHCDFVATWPDRYKEWFCIRLDEHMVGSAYLTRANEFGMFIKKGFQGRGIARHAFAWIAKRHKGETLYSNVNPNNKRIIGLLKSIGCRLIQETYVHP